MSGVVPELTAYAKARWAPFLASATIIAGQAWLAGSLSLRPAWLLPVLTAGLLLASAFAYRSETQEPNKLLRWLTGAVVGMLALANALCLLMLVRHVFLGTTRGPLWLLFAGLTLWVVNIAIFALAYWEVDGGGPEERERGGRDYPDLVFPQQQADQEHLVPPDWKPGFSDYLYVSVTASTAFSPTDAMPYSRKAKLLMGAESTISFLAVAMLLARAVNIATG